MGAAIVFAALVIIGCSSPFGADPGDDNAGASAAGSVVVSTGSGVGALTVFPELDRSKISAYRVTLKDGPGAAQDHSRVWDADSDGSFPESDVRFDDVVPGDWTVEIEAFDADPDPEDSGARRLLHGQEEVSVVAGSEVSADVTLKYLGSGEGEYEINVQWSADKAVQEAEYRISDLNGNGGAWQTQTIEEGENSNVQSITVSGTREAGPFWLTVRLNDDDNDAVTDEVVVDELVYVYANVTTRATISFVLSNEEATAEVVKTVENVVEDDPDWEGDDEGSFKHLASGAGTLEFEGFQSFAVVSMDVRLDEVAGGQDSRNVFVRTAADDGNDGHPIPLKQNDDEFRRVAFAVPADTAFSIEFQGGGSNWTFGGFAVDVSSYTEDTSFVAPDYAGAFDGVDEGDYVELIWMGVLSAEE